MNTMEAMMKILNLATLQADFAAGQVSSISLKAAKGWFEILWTTANRAATLANVSGNGALQFRDPAEALLLLKKIGIHSVHIDTAEWEPEIERAYDDWLIAKVEVSLAGLQDGTNRTYSADEWAEIRAARGWGGKAT